MNVRTFLTWLPHVLSLLFVVFISIFALDVFGEYSGWELLLALFMHLIPSIVLLTVTLIAWKFDLAGALIFFGFAAFYVWDVGFEKPWSWYAFIAGPAALVGALYLLSWVMKRRHVQKSERSREETGGKTPEV